MMGETKPIRKRAMSMRRRAPRVEGDAPIAVRLDDIGVPEIERASQLAASDPGEVHVPIETEFAHRLVGGPTGWLSPRKIGRAHV